MQLVVEPDGAVRCIYSEEFILHSLGKPVLRRASHVEPDGSGQRTADLSPVSGPKLKPFATRSQALAAENRWRERHWLTSVG